MSDRLDKLFDTHLADIFGDRQEEFTVQLRDRLRALWMRGVKTKVEDMTAKEEDEFVRGVSITEYPAKVGKWSPEWPVSSERDRKFPACPSCGGRGIGDYPYACHTCGGSGNDYRR